MPRGAGVRHGSVMSTQQSVATIPVCPDLFECGRSTKQQKNSAVASVQMKILHAIQSADPAGGGPIEGIRQLAAATRAEQEHHIVTLDDPDAPFLNAFPLPITALGPSSLLGYSPRLTPWLRRRAQGYDCVVIHGLWRYISFGGWRALRGSVTPYVVMPHGMLDPWFKRAYPLKHLKKWLFWPWTEYRVLKDATAVVFTCEEERLRARQSFWLYRCNEAIGSQTVASPTGNARAQRIGFLRQFPQLQGKRILLFLGRIHRKKGCDLLLSAFSSVAGEHPNLNLVMAGPCHDGWDQDLQSQAERLGIAQRITWTGMLAGDLKWGAFRSAEAFLLPSHQENFGIAVAEALACGVPVLVSDQVQIWREIAEDGAGIVEPDSLAGTQQLLHRWLALSPTQRTAMAEAARHCYARRFETGIAADKLSRIFRQAATLA
jgi:glycosyltransferase involved in cell wall biosynthesis